RSLFRHRPAAHISGRPELRNACFLADLLEIRLDAHADPDLLGGAAGQLRVHPRPIVEIDEAKDHRQFLFPAWKVHHDERRSRVRVNGPRLADLDPVPLTFPALGTAGLREEIDRSAALTFLHNQLALAGPGPDRARKVGDFGKRLPIGRLAHGLPLQTENNCSTAPARASVRDSAEAERHRNRSVLDLPFARLATQLRDGLDQWREAADRAA